MSGIRTFYLINEKLFVKNIFILFIIVFLTPSAFSQVEIMPFGESTTEAPPAYRKKFCDLIIADGLSIDMIGPNSDGPGLSYDSDNAGFIGITCSLLIDKLYSDCNGYSPDIVLLWEGTNDCGWNYQNFTDNHPIIDELSLLIDSICLKYPNALVFVGSIPPMASTSYAYFGVAKTNAAIYNEAMPGMIAAKAASGKKVHFVDARSLSIHTDISADSIHPNQAGYDKMAVLFYDAVKPFITTIVTGTSDIEENEVLVYPNPVINSQLTINLNNSFTEKISLSLYNMAGQKVYSEDVRYAPSVSISLPQYLTKGLYFLKVKNEMNTVIKSIVIE